MHSIKFCVHLPLPPIFSLWQVVLEFVDTYQPWKQRHIHYGSNQGCVPFCFIVLGTTKNSLFYQDSSGLLMKFMPIALYGIPHLSYFNEPLESDWIRHSNLNLKIQASQGSQHLPILPNKILFWLNKPEWYCLSAKSFSFLSKLV